MIKAQRHNIRDYGMYIAFVVIVVFFTIATKGLFVSSRNIGNLVNATSYIAVLAVGMTLVIVIRHIDLSVGYLAGTLGAVAAIALKYWDLPVCATIPLVLALGVLAGLVTAFLVAQMKIPAFVATLAGWLFYQGAPAACNQRHGHDHHRERCFQRSGQRVYSRHSRHSLLPEYTK